MTATTQQPKSTAPARATFPVKPLYIGIVLILCASYLALVRLDYTTFWDDESEVGIIAKTFVHTGQLTGWDGRNLFGYHTGTLLDQNLRPINPPLEYWVAAASFKIFGISTSSGRLPFALLGIGALVIFAVMLRKELKENETLWLYAVALFALSVTFLMFIRQCRYFSLTLFFSVLTFFFYRRCLKSRGALDFILLGASAALLFYSHYLICAAFMMTLTAVHFVFFRKGLTRTDWLKFAFAGVVFLMGTVPYAIHFKIWVRPDLPEHHDLVGQKLRMIGWIFRDANALNCLPWTIAVALVVFLWMRRKDEVVRNTILPWLAMGIGFLLFLGFVAEVTEGSDESPIRYFLPVVPFLSVGIAGLLWFIHQRSRPAAIGLLVVLLATDVLAITPSNLQSFKQHKAFPWLLPAYVTEVHRDYPTPYRAVSDYLEKNAAKDATVFCFPDFCTYPVMFYTGDKVRFGGLLDFRATMAEKKIFTPESFNRFSAINFYDELTPDYIIAFGEQEGAVNSMKYFSRGRDEGGQNAEYQLATKLNVFWYDTSRPELTRHTFGPRDDFDPEHESVFVFKRVH